MFHRRMIYKVDGVRQVMTDVGRQLDDSEVQLGQNHEAELSDAIYFIDLVEGNAPLGGPYRTRFAR